MQRDASAGTMRRKLSAGIVLAIATGMGAGHGMAQNGPARLENDRLVLPAVRVGGDLLEAELSMTRTAQGPQFQLERFSVLPTADATNPGVFSGDVLTIPVVLVDSVFFRAELELTGRAPFQFRLLSAAPVTDESPAATCERHPDRSNGPDSPTISSGWSIPVNLVRDGGPAPDGIPPLEQPRFLAAGTPVNIAPDQLVVGVKLGNEVRAYPHNILDWHEVVNDCFNIDGATEAVTLSYCPLTGSAVLWDAFAASANPTFGTSGLLYNSNLIMYDRKTGSLWSQMLEQAVSGAAILEVPNKLQVVETTWHTWSSMYPQTAVMSEATGFSRDYSRYPYGTYRTNTSLLFIVANSQDGRLHRKERVTVGNVAKVYPIAHFAGGVDVINDQVGDEPIVVAGSSGSDFAVIYSRMLSDCTELEFTALQNQLPMIMQDHEGTAWDIFGVAQGGPRAGETLYKTNSYIAYWFAWAAFFPGSAILE